ncbi:hypothetical protein BKA83DRAFT_13488, partial [Pisolithus microcarpus]
MVAVKMFEIAVIYSTTLKLIDPILSSTPSNVGATTSRMLCPAQRSALLTRQMLNKMHTSAFLEAGGGPYVVSCHTYFSISLSLSSALDANTRRSDDMPSPLTSPTTELSQTQPLPGTTSKHPTQQRQHPVQSVPSQGGLPSRLPRNSHSQSVREQHALPRLPSSRGGVSLRLAATSHQSEQVRSNMSQLNVSQNRERSRTPTPVLLRSSSPVVSHHTPGRQAVGARRDGIHETREANQEPGVDYDVLGRHHSLNRRRRSPSPTYLNDVHCGHMSQDRRPSKKTRPDAMLSGRQSAAEELMDVDNAKANSGKGSARLGRARNTVIVKPTTLAFYPPLWTKLLDEAKARIRLYVATEEPFLRLETAVDG